MESTKEERSKPNLYENREGEAKVRKNESTFSFQCKAALNQEAASAFLKDWFRGTFNSIFGSVRFSSVQFNSITDGTDGTDGTDSIKIKVWGGILDRYLAQQVGCRHSHVDQLRQS